MNSSNLTIQQKVNAAGECYVIEDLTVVGNLIDNIQVWGIERNITPGGGATALSQIAKLRKEIDELEAGLKAGDDHEITDGIGDALVVLAMIARLTRKPWDVCLDQAWSDIKDRTGEMHCGIFVKQVDLDRIQQYNYRAALTTATNADAVETVIEAAMAASLADQATQ